MKLFVSVIATLIAFTGISSSAQACIACANETTRLSSGPGAQEEELSVIEEYVLDASTAEGTRKLKGDLDGIVDDIRGAYDKLHTRAHRSHDLAVYKEAHAIRRDATAAEHFVRGVYADNLHRIVKSTIGDLDDGISKTSLRRYAKAKEAFEELVAGAI